MMYIVISLCNIVRTRRPHLCPLYMQPVKSIYSIYHRFHFHRKTLSMNLMTIPKCLYYFLKLILICNQISVTYNTKQLPFVSE